MKRISMYSILLLSFCTFVITGQTFDQNGRDPSYLPKSILPEKSNPIVEVQSKFISDSDHPQFNKALIAENLMVQGSLAIGDGTPASPSFGFNTMILTENNLRIRFDDNSGTGFPSNDWTIVINDIGGGTDNYFAIEDFDAGRIPFKIMAGAAANSIYVRSNGNVGFKTDNPVTEIHMRDTDTPAIRFEQTGGAWSPQTWDIAGNESNFFIRDVTNGSQLPFRIRPGAPTNSIYVNDDGYVGVGNTNPDQKLHVFGHIKTDSLIKITPIDMLTSSPEEGDIKMDNTDHVLKYFNGSEWKSMGVNSDEQDLVSATLTGTILNIEIENGASVSVDLSPILTDIEAQISALEAQISALEARISTLEGVVNVTSPIGENIQLFQNIPNPSDGHTYIPYYIPVSYDNAKIVVYDAQGALINEFIIEERGIRSEVILDYYKLKSGMYFYSLIVDGKPFDTKSMSIIN